MSCYLVSRKQNYEMEQCRQVITYHKLTATLSPGPFRGAADGVTHARGLPLKLSTQFTRGAFLEVQAHTQTLVSNTSQYLLFTQGSNFCINL